MYILTIKEKDGDNDKASQLCRGGLYRVNLGIRKSTFAGMFGPVPKRPPAGGIVAMDYDFTQVNAIMPHPVYGWMGWIGVINPTADTFDRMKPLIDESYAYAKEKYGKRK